MVVVVGAGVRREKRGKVTLSLLETKNFSSLCSPQCLAGETVIHVPVLPTSLCLAACEVLIERDDLGARRPGSELWLSVRNRG